MASVAGGGSWSSRQERLFDGHGCRRPVAGHFRNPDHENRRPSARSYSGEVALPIRRLPAAPMQGLIYDRYWDQWVKDDDDPLVGEQRSQKPPAMTVGGNTYPAQADNLPKKT